MRRCKRAYQGICAEGGKRIKVKAMREILFRGKRIDNDEWVYGYLSKSRDENRKLSLCIDYEEKGVMCSSIVIPSTIGQYTGLVDKNNKKIFEGDIIRYADIYDYNCFLESIDYPEAYDGIDIGNIWNIDKVIYDIEMGYPAFDLYSHDWDVNGLSNLNESSEYFYEVIGNIHDNPELLTGGKGQ